MPRHLFLIALLSVLLPGGVLPGDMIPVDRALDAPASYVVALRAMPGAGRACARTLRKQVAARPVHGVYMIPARRPAALAASRRLPVLTDRCRLRPATRRAPPALV